MKSILFSLLFMYNAVVVQAQQVTASAGDHASAATGTLSWTLGEGFTETYTGNTATLTQGFQQTTLTVTDISDISAGVPGIVVFPNPVSDLVKLRVNASQVKDFEYRVYDLKGKLLDAQQLESSETTISFAGYVPGTYLLKLSEKNREHKVFKIIKK